MTAKRDKVTECGFLRTGRMGGKRSFTVNKTITVMTSRLEIQVLLSLDSGLSQTFLRISAAYAFHDSAFRVTSCSKQFRKSDCP